jgi:hypothetical protein
MVVHCDGFLKLFSLCVAYFHKPHFTARNGRKIAHKLTKATFYKGKHSFH